MKFKHLMEYDGSQFDSLAQFLNDIVALIDQSKVSHWNLRSPNFTSLHPFFGELYDAAIGMADSVAEQIRILDINELVSVRHGETTETFGEVENLQLLSDALANAIESGSMASNDYDDATKNLVDGLVMDLGKWKWKVDSSMDAGLPVPTEEDEIDMEPEAGEEEEEV